MGDLLRVLTYNVRGLRDDTSALVRVIRATDPDVVCLQEAPRMLRWRPRIAALARACALSYVAGGGSTGGTALLAHLRVGVEQVHEHRLTKTRGLHQRGLAVARLSVDMDRDTDVDVDVDVASIHLGLDAAERVRHADEALVLLSGRTSRVPLVLAGDLNEAPGGPAWARLAASGLTDVCDRGGSGADVTFSTRNPRRRIDAVLIAGGLGVVQAGVPTDLIDPADLVAASDHRPVLAVLRPDRTPADPSEPETARRWSSA